MFHARGRASCLTQYRHLVFDLPSPQGAVRVQHRLLVFLISCRYCNSEICNLCNESLDGNKRLLSMFFDLLRAFVVAFLSKGIMSSMYPIKDYPNPMTRELINLANEYGQDLTFAKEPTERSGERRFVRFSFSSRPAMQAFQRFLLGRGFLGDLRVVEDLDRNAYTITCPSASA